LHDKHHTKSQNAPDTPNAAPGVMSAGGMEVETV
jgi:hypothetical protein